MLDVISHPVVEVYPCLHITNTPLEIYQLALRRECLTTLSPIQRCTKSWSKSYQPGPPGQHHCSQCGKIDGFHQSSRTPKAHSQ
jgi:hypothetical protein